MWSIAGRRPIKSFNCDMHFLRTSCFYAFSSLSKLSVSSVIRDSWARVEGRGRRALPWEQCLKRSNCSSPPRWEKEQQPTAWVDSRIHQSEGFTRCWQTAARRSFIWEKCVIRSSQEEEKWLPKTRWEAFRQICSAFPNKGDIFSVSSMLRKKTEAAPGGRRPRSLFSVSI